jgi:hypothetical protein
VLLSFSLTLTVLAQEQTAPTTEEPVEASILPDSPLYWLKMLGEKIQETFTLIVEKNYN